MYINERTNMYLKEYLESRKDNDPALFVGSKKPNSRLTKTGIEDIIRRIGEKAGVENAHPHRFRRTALTNALNRNASAGGYDICGTRKVRDNHAILYSESGRCTVSSL